MEDEWEFTVEESFNITGRGTGVVGVLRGVIRRSGEAAMLHVGTTVTRVEKVDVEFLLAQRQERLALLLSGLNKDACRPARFYADPPRRRTSPPEAAA